MTKPKRSRIAFNRFAKTPFETIVSQCHTHRGRTAHRRPDRGFIAMKAIGRLVVRGMLS